VVNHSVVAGLGTFIMGNVFVFGLWGLTRSLGGNFFSVFWSYDLGGADVEHHLGAFFLGK